MTAPHFIPRSSPEIQAICKPLFDKLDLAYFNYGKIYLDGTCLGLISSPEWSGYLLETQKKVKMVSPKPQEKMQVENVITLWEGRAAAEAMQMFTSLGFYHPIMFIAMGDGYTESFSFASKHNSTRSIETYFNHLVILRKFCAYFREVADTLVGEADKQENRLVLGTNSLSYKIEDYIDEGALENSDLIDIRLDQNIISITQRQRQCLDYLSKGLSAKEIALKLKISPRTVETHLTHVKNKFNVHFKSDLLKMWKDAFYL